MPFGTMQTRWWDILLALNDLLPRRRFAKTLMRRVRYCLHPRAKYLAETKASRRWLRAAFRRGLLRPEEYFFLIRAAATR